LTRALDNILRTLQDPATARHYRKMLKGYVGDFKVKEQELLAPRNGNGSGLRNGPPQDGQQRVLVVSEVAKIMRTTEAKVRELVKQDKLKLAVTGTRGFKILASSVIAMLHPQSPEEEPPSSDS
jgi:hypothetical protein